MVRTTAHSQISIPDSPYSDEESINKQFDVDIDTMLEQLHTQEDTDKNWQITIEDSGPKVRSQLT